MVVIAGTVVVEVAVTAEGGTYPGQVGLLCGLARQACAV